MSRKHVVVETPDVFHVDEQPGIPMVTSREVEKLRALARGLGNVSNEPRVLEDIIVRACAILDELCLSDVESEPLTEAERDTLT